MTTPTLTEFAAVACNAVRNDAGAWNDCTATEQSAIMGRVRHGLNYLAAMHEIEREDIYAAGPGDPPPVQPEG